MEIRRYYIHLKKYNMASDLGLLYPEGHLYPCSKKMFGRYNIFGHRTDVASSLRNIHFSKYLLYYKIIHLACRCITFQTFPFLKCIVYSSVLNLYAVHSSIENDNVLKNVLSSNEQIIYVTYEYKSQIPLIN